MNNRVIKIFLLSGLIFLILCLVIYITITSYKMYRSSSYIFLNDKYCGEKKCNYIPEKFMDEPNPTSFTRQYQKNYAEFSLNIISYLEGLVDLPDGLEKIKDLTLVEEKLPLGVILSNKKRDILWITFRGSKKIFDWVKDFSISQKNIDKDTMIHSGFTYLYNEVKPQILDTIKDFDKSQNIVVSGHSLGGSIALITAVELLKEDFNNVVVYTMASPRVGNKELADIVNEKMVHYRIVNDSDIIPTFPLAVVPNMDDYKNPYLYYHNGIEKPFNINASSISSNHNTLVYYNGLSLIQEEIRKLQSIK